MATIQWYPGHMNKARNQLEDKMGLIDVLVEVLDARIPEASRNPMIEELVGNKPHIIILNKADLADPALTKEWAKKLNGPDKYVLALDSLHNTNMQKLISLVKKAASEKTKKLEARGASNPTIRIALTGIPNCGKSTVINRLVGRNVAEVGNKPGVTKGKQWIHINKKLELLDTPGILWPKFDDKAVGLRLAMIGSMNDQILNLEDLAFEILKYIKDNYPGAIQMRYEIDENQEIIQIMDEIGAKRGCLKKNALIDYEKLSGIITDDFRSGRMGRITLEMP